MFESPAVTRQLVENRIHDGLSEAADRRLVGAVRRRDRQPVRSRLTHRFGAAHRAASAPRTATA